MLRPTQSAIIFVQQLGRGLRKLKSRDKYLTVIDFIGNYKQNFLIPVALFGDQSFEKDEIRRLMVGGNDLLPGESTIDFDEIAYQRVFDAVNQANLQAGKELRSDYKSMKAKVGRRPLMVDFIERNARDPYSFVRYKKSFYSFALDVEEPGDVGVLLDPLPKVLEVLSKFALNGKYLEEIEIVKELLKKGSCDLEALSEKLPGPMPNARKLKHLNSAVSNLNLEFRRDRKIVDGKPKLVPFKEVVELDLVAVENDTVRWGEGLLRLWGAELALQLEDICSAAEQQFKKGFDVSLYHEGLVRYRKYDRGDVFRTLLWRENPVAQNVGGYLIAPDKSNCPIFVTYDKSDEIASSIQYEDSFISPTQMIWFSKSKRTLASPEIEYFSSLTETQRLPLFVKKSDDEGISFYYLGDVRPEADSFSQETMPLAGGGRINVVRLIFNLDRPVPDSLYKYLTT